MRITPVRISLFILALLVPAALAACGGGGSSGGSEDPQAVLDQTFNNSTKVTSGNLNVSISASATGSQSGSFSASLDGPFQSDPNDTTAFPQLDLTAKVDGSGAGQSISFEGGVTATADQAFVTYQGQAYEVPSATFQQFKQAYAANSQAATSSSGSSNASSILKDLGIDPATWLTNVTNEGDADVEGTTTTHIHGDADVSQIFSDFAKAAQNVPGATTQGLDPTQIQQASSFVKSASVDVYSGKDDHVLRKLEVNVDITPPSSAATAGVTGINVDFSIELSNVNSPQTITAPSSSKAALRPRPAARRARNPGPGLEHSAHRPRLQRHQLQQRQRGHAGLYQVHPAGGLELHEAQRLPVAVGAPAIHASVSPGPAGVRAARLR